MFIRRFFYLGKSGRCRCYFLLKKNKMISTLALRFGV